MESFNEEIYQVLLKREEMYRQIVESSAEAIMIHCDEKFVYVNQAGVKLLGVFSKEEIIGKPVFGVQLTKRGKHTLSKIRHNKSRFFLRLGIIDFFEVNLFH
ncbi:PAS domain S-box protein [Aneurinibacillus tyrosinisolvens]|uniref:PAS domain S-box protein n=1 Tax=Aneurinibacillus tyrosinisolvens TaxID=1443435 RepID=UPI00063ED956|nr:PAS domain S-box protein [Aneurinibacillus tyrosinisolvens]